MRILVVGATGALGRDVVTEAVARDHSVAALVRDSARASLPAEVERVEGDVLQVPSLTAAVQGREAVICALGTPSPRRPRTLLEEGTKNLVAAMTQEPMQRLICVTLLGAGSSRANASLLYRGVVLRLLAPMVPDKEAQERAVRDSDLEWLIVRSPRFVGGKARGRLRVIREGQRGRLGHVVRADLARFLVDSVADSQHLGQAVAVGS